MTQWTDNDDALFGDKSDPRLRMARRVALILVALCAVGLIWASLAELDEVSVGTGRVVPTTREQVIQSLEGGILAKIHVRQDSLVEPGQILAQLDPTQVGSTVEETAAKYRAALAAAARLRAEVNQTPITFPAELDAFPDLKASETRLYQVRRASLRDATALIEESIRLLDREISVATSLEKVGAASRVEILRLQRQKADLQLRKSEVTSEYIVAAREELAKAQEQVEALEPVIRGRSDTLDRLTLKSPVRGIVKSIEVSTVGGVIPPNGEVMQIIPLDDQLMIEARMSPQDIAFIHPGQRAVVKITAYDYAIYGGLEGEVTSISPDTIRDEVKPDQYYYRVFVRTREDALIDKAGKAHAIVPGMIATVDVHTGRKTVLQYLLKPLNKGREALRER